MNVLCVVVYEVVCCCVMACHESHLAQTWVTRVCVCVSGTLRACVRACVCGGLSCVLHVASCTLCDARRFVCDVLVLRTVLSSMEPFQDTISMK